MAEKIAYQFWELSAQLILISLFFFEVESHFELFFGEEGGFLVFLRIDIFWEEFSFC